MMTKPQPLTKREPLVIWLHAGASPIVYRTSKAVDGAPLPYTAAMIERHRQRTGVNLLADTILPKAANW